MSNDTRNAEAATNVIADVMRHDPKASINDLARACVEAGVTVSKPFVAQMRMRLRQELERKARGGIQTIEALGERVDAVLDDADRIAAKADREREDAVRREKVRAEREARWAERQAEREAKWAAERQTQGAQDFAQAARDLAPLAALALPTPCPLPPIEQLQAAPAPAAPAPVPAPVTPPRPTGTSRSASDRALRRQYLNELLDKDPGADPIILLARLKERFGVALDHGYVYETCRVAREIAGLPELPSYEPGRKVYGARPGLPTFEAEAVERAGSTTPEEDLGWLLRQLGDIMRAHGLASVTVMASGEKAQWEFIEKPREPRRGSGEVTFTPFPEEES